MARSKTLYIRDAQEALRQAQSIIAEGVTEVQQARAAAVQALQAATALNQLAGAMDAELDLPKREPARSV